MSAGDVEIGLMERNGQLEVEIIQARGLIMKPGSKGPPGDSSSHRGLSLIQRLHSFSQRTKPTANVYRLVLKY